MTDNKAFLIFISYLITRGVLTVAITAETRLEIMWGVPTLDDGFSAIPNLLIRKYRKLGMTNGEACFINLLITFRHDERDPYPSRKTLADYLECSERQITKWIRSLKSKGLLSTEQQEIPVTGKWKKNVFSFKPLLDALANLVGEKKKPSSQTFSHDESVEQKKTEKVDSSHSTESTPRTSKVPKKGNLRFQRGGLQVPSKKKKEKDNRILDKDDDDRACANTLQSEFISTQLLNESEFKRVMSRVMEVNPFNLLSYARKALLTAVQRKNYSALLHTKKMESETDRARVRESRPKKKISHTYQPYQRPAIPVVQPPKSAGLSPEELERARDLARRLDAGELYTRGRSFRND